jgi:hypothetical protein
MPLLLTRLFLIPFLDPGVVPVTVGLAFTVMSAVLFALMTELQLLDEVSPLANFVIVMVNPSLGRVVVVKLPDPAVHSLEPHTLLHSVVGDCVGYCNSEVVEFTDMLN